MQISQALLKRYFPDDNRFIYWVCTKRYGWGFKDDFEVAEVRSQATYYVVKKMNEGFEFDDEAHINGYIINVIMNSYKSMLRDKNYNKNQMLQFENALTYGEGEQEYNKYRETAKAVSHEYDNLFDTLKDMIGKRFDPIMVDVFERAYINQETTPEIAKHYGWSPQAVRQRRERLLRFLKKKINEDGSIKKGWAAVQDVQPQDRSKPAPKITAPKNSVGEARTLLHSLQQL